MELPAFKHSFYPQSLVHTTQPVTLYCIIRQGFHFNPEDFGRVILSDFLTIYTVCLQLYYKVQEPFKGKTFLQTPCVGLNCFYYNVI